MIETWLGTSFAGLGVRPGEWSGLVGVLAAPLLHGSPAHVLSNSLPMLVLGTLTLAVYPRTAGRAIVLVWLLSGLGIWLFGPLRRRATASKVSRHWIGGMRAGEDDMAPIVAWGVAARHGRVPAMSATDGLVCRDNRGHPAELAPHSCRTCPAMPCSTTPA